MGVVALAIVYSGLYSTDNLACQVLRELLDAQKAIDSKRSIPKDFTYVPHDLVAECGGEAFRMPYPYKTTLKEMYEPKEIHRRFFALKKEHVRTRAVMPPVNDSRYDVNDIVGNIQDTVFTASYDEVKTLPDAQGCLSTGSCALFFDNSWTWPDVLPLLKTSKLNLIFQHAKFGNMFCSNLTEQRLTAKPHSAPFHGSIAVTLAGRKDWVFYDPDTLHREGIRANDVTVAKSRVSSILPATGISGVLRNIDQFHVSTTAGELLYFPSHWTHIVRTDSEWNLMVNLRMANTPAAIIASFANARKIHSLKGALRLLAMNLFLTLAPESTFKALIEGSHDTLKDEGAVDQWLRDFAILNLDAL